MNNLSKRLISGTIYVSLVVSAIWFESKWFTVLLSLFCLLALLEANRLNSTQTTGSGYMTALIYSGLIIYLILFQNLEQFRYEYLIGMLIQFIMVFFMRRKLVKEGRSGLLFDTLYIWLPLFALAVYYHQGGKDVAMHLYFFFGTIWLYDSMAYVFGKSFGRHKIFPIISPGKTWEGTIGGGLFAILLSFMAELWFIDLPFNVIVAALLIVFFSTIGDFLESYYKRKVGVKDSGNLIPGHGGILDRLDSILFACFPYLIYINMIAEK